MNAILLGALGAVVGGAVGAGLGGALGRGLGKGGKPAPRLGVGLAAALAVLGGVGAPLVFRPSMASQVEQNPAVAVLKQYYPDKYKQVRAVENSGKPAAVAAIVGGTVREHSRQIDDASAHRMFALLVSESRLMRDKAPGACISMLAGGAAHIDLASLMTPQMKKAEADNTAAVLTQIATHPAAPAQPIDRVEIGLMGRTALAKLAPADQALVNNVMAERRAPNSEPEARAMCSFDIEMFQTALDGPPGRIRSLIAVG